MTIAPTKYYMNKRNPVLGSLILLLVTLLGVYLTLGYAHRQNLPSYLSAIMAFVGIVVPCTALLIVVSSTLFTTGPAIELSDTGVRWNASLLVRGHVEWREIQSVSCEAIGGAWFVTLHLTDLDAFIARQPLLTRLVQRWMVNTGWPISPASIPGTGVVGTSAGKIAKQLRTHLDNGI
jgi:hypothetical protein